MKKYTKLIQVDFFWKLNIRQINQNQKKIPDPSNLSKNTSCNNKVTEIENKIPSNSGLTTNAALTTVEIEIPNISSLVKEKQIITQKLQKVKVNLLIMIVIII